MLSLFEVCKMKFIDLSERHPHSLSITSVASILCAIVYIFSVNQSALASGSWNQTDWSGGSGSSTTNQYGSLSNVDVTSAVGSIKLSKTEMLSNGDQNTNSTGWDTNTLYSTPTLIQSKSTGLSTGTVSSVTATFDMTPTQGNTIIAALAVQGSSVLTLPSGYTTDFDYRNDTTNTRIIYLRKVAGASESATITVSTATARYMNLDIYEFANISSSSPLDTTATLFQSANASTVPIGPTSTPAQSNELALAMASWSSGVATPTWNNSFTKGPLPTGSGASVLATSAYKPITTAQAVSATATTTGSRTGTGVIATYKTNSAISSATHESSVVHGGEGSTRLIAVSTDDAAFTQAVNVGDTNNYNLEAYIYTDGSAVTNSDAVLVANDSTISTTYTDAGSGWYKLTGSTAGAASSVNYGLKVKAGKTVYVDDFSMYKYATNGTLTSNIYDTFKPSNWGTLSYTSSGTLQVKARSSNSPSMNGAPEFSTCTAVSSGSDISTGTGSCVTDAQRYIQYEVTLSTVSTETSATLDDITFDFVDSDAVAPTTNATDILLYTADGGTEVSENNWLNSAEPYFSWTAGADNVGGLGIKGYCLYLGQTESSDPETTEGLLGSTSPLDTENACPFAVSGTTLDLSINDYLATALTSDDDLYYLNIKAIDNSNNIIDTSESFAFKFDNTKPSNPSYITAPSYFINTKEATMTWSTAGNDSASDAHSGVIGLQYRIGAAGTWYGDSHSGDQNASDLLSNDGSYTTISTPDFDNLIDGNNVVYFRTWDEAGNTSTAYVTAVIKINTTSPTGPQSVVATPSTNTDNSFAFNWEAPATFGGSEGNLVYCYSVNTLPSIGTCSYTAAGITSLSAGPYATQPGENTFYVVAKDEAGNINYATAASVTFTANTSAPGIPLNIDVVDISVKSTDNWRLALSWDEPTDTGAGIASYKVYRSTDNVTFTNVASTAGTSYVDGGLSQQKYYYKVRACDSANNCGAYTSAVDETPTGKYTTPANSTSRPEVTNVSTRKATISWSTDRQSDSRIQYGIKSGQYFATEAAISDQVTDHEVLLNNLTAGTTYYYKAKWTDEDGNTGQSAELSFKTAPAPVVKEVTSEPSLSDADVNFTSKDAAKVKIYFGKSESFGGVTTLNTSLTESKYGTTLTGLDDGSKYFFKLNTLDSDGNEYEGNVYSFTTPPRPRITNLRFQPVKDQPSSTQKVTWNTNVPASSEITYGVRRPTQTLSQSKLTTEHEVTIKGLSDDSDYVLIARSRDASGNVATSDQQSFKTALDTRPPKISDITVDASIRGTGAEARGQVVISWKTDEPATSQVAYGEGSSGFLSSVSSEDAKLTTDHVVVVSDLSTSRVYHFEPRSFDRARNEAKGAQQVAIIGRASENVLSIIFNALQKMFGIN